MTSKEYQSKKKKQSAEEKWFREYFSVETKELDKYDRIAVNVLEAFNDSQKLKSKQLKTPQHENQNT